MTANAVRGCFPEGGTSLLQPGRLQMRLRGRTTRTGQALRSWAQRHQIGPESNLSSKLSEMESSSNLPNNITTTPLFDGRSSASLPPQSGPSTHPCWVPGPSAAAAAARKHAGKTSAAGSQLQAVGDRLPGIQSFRQIFGFYHQPAVSA